MAHAVQRGVAHRKKIVELPDFRECVVAVKHGLSWAEATAMHPIERRAFLYYAAMLDGGTVNWTTGEVKFPKVGGNP